MRGFGRWPPGVDVSPGGLSAFAELGLTTTKGDIPLYQTLLREASFYQLLFRLDEDLAGVGSSQRLRLRRPAPSSALPAKASRGSVGAFSVYLASSELLLLGRRMPSSSYSTVAALSGSEGVLQRGGAPDPGAARRAEG